jgi:hypothetical protein
MTTATMSLGMLPLALKLEPGAESRAPMAVVVIGGLLSSTFLAIFVTPALYTLLDDLQNIVLRKKHAPVLVTLPEHVPAESEHAPAPVPVGATAAVLVDGNGTNGHTNGNGHGNGNGHAEPTWLQRLKAGSFDD